MDVEPPKLISFGGQTGRLGGFPFPDTVVDLSDTLR